MSGLFTVLIAEKEHIDAIRQENKLFFEPFLESKDLEFCCWNPAGQSLSDSVPGLLDAVGRRKHWRAVIINNAEVFSKSQNPFDVVDYSAAASLTAPKRQPNPDEDWGAWEADWKAYYEALTKKKETIYHSALEYPLQKLTTWLCFKPEDYVLNEVQEKQDVHDWAMERIGRDEIKPSIKLELMERNQYKCELRMKETIRRAFTTQHYLDISNPAEVYCISIRTSENSFFDPDAYWNIRQENEYSTFADRNMYFDKMRFMVFDLLPQTHRNFRTDYIRFLASVLILISNPIPSSAMQARHLYRLETETDDTPLCTLVTSYDRKLASTAEVIENEMERIRSEIPGEMTDKAAAALFCTPKDIVVQLDESCDPAKVFTEKEFGLFQNHPGSDSSKWESEYRISKNALDNVAKQQGRSLRKSVIQMHSSAEISDVNVNRLTSFQMDDVREYTDTAEDEMVASIPPDFTDMNRYTERMAQEAEKVKRTLGQRMSKKTAITLGAMCLGLYLACFLPFLFSNTDSIKMITTAIILIVAMLGIMAVIMLSSLISMNASIRDAVRAYNDAARASIKEIQSSMNRFSKYLSAAYNVRRGYAIQNYAKKNLDEYTKSLRIRKKHQEDIRKRRAYLVEGYRDYFGGRSFCDETMARPYDYDFDQTVEYEYPAPFLSGDGRQIEFISNGNYVAVPSSYVKRILVRVEGIYEQ